MEEQTRQQKSPKNTSKPRPNKAMRRLIISAIIVAAILIGMPFGIQYGVIKALKDAGSQQVELKDVDFNPFTGVLVLKKLSATSGKSPELKFSLLSVEIDWLPLFKKQLLIKALHLKDSSVDIQQLEDKTVKIAGIILPKAAEDTSSEKSAWGVGIAGVHFTNNHINIKSPTFATTVKIDDLALAQLISWNEGQASDVSFDAYINGAHVSADLALDVFTEKPSVKGSLKLDKLELSHFQSMVRDTLTELNGRLSTDITFVAELSDNGFTYKQGGTVALTKSTIIANGLQIKQPNTLWQGDIGLVKNSDAVDIDVSGDLTATQLSADNTHTKVKIFQIDTAKLQGLSINGLENIQINKLLLDGLLVAQKASEKTALAVVENIVVDTLQLNNTADIAIKSVLINGLEADVHANKEGEIAVLKDLFVTADKEQTAEPKKATKQGLIKIGSIKTTGENNVKIAYQIADEHIKKLIHIRKLEMGELNSDAANKLTPIVFDATINKHSILFIDGGIAPFSKKTNANIKAKLKAFELPEFSPIIRNELGYDIQSGQLNADINVEIKQNILDGKMQLDIHGLVMEPADADKMAKMTQQLSMPLDSALSLLRDDKDDISLKIPVKGDLAKPDFDVADVINTALGNALQGTVKNVLTYALQPYGMIFMLASKAYEVSTSISLDAIEFSAGQSVLSGNTASYLEKIGGLMKKRPGLRIRLCGVATPSDRVVLQKQKTSGKKEQSQDKPVKDLVKTQMQALAKARASSIKSILVKDYSIDATRLFICLPKVVTEAQKPRVDILI